MLRGIEITINPNIKYSDSAIGCKKKTPDWQRSIHYLDGTIADISKKTSKTCKLIEKILLLRPLFPITTQIKTTISYLEPVLEVASGYTTAESFGDAINKLKKAKMGFKVGSIKKVLAVVKKGVSLISWFTIVKKLGYTFQVFNSLPSMKLGIALMSPALDLIKHLRKEGMAALKSGELYKTSYQLGISLLAVYMYVCSATLSVYLTAFISGVDFMLAAPEYINTVADLF